MWTCTLALCTDVQARATCVTATERVGSRAVGSAKQQRQAAAPSSRTDTATGRAAANDTTVR